MEETNKLPLKRVEVSLNKFNEVAIPHHLDLLRQHRANIVKYSARGELSLARGEQAGAARVAVQLRALLLELDALRRRVASQDLPRFDALTQRSRDTTLRAIVDYLGVIEKSCRALVSVGRDSTRRLGTSPLDMKRPTTAAEAAASAVSTDSVGVVAHAEADADGDMGTSDQTQILLHIDDQEVALQEREALLRGWVELQAELRALHDVWQHVQAAALAQREQVAETAAHVELAADNVSAARTSLAAAERLRTSFLCVGCTMLGALAGGPVGLLAGAKAGAAVALGGSLLGLGGAMRLLRREPPPEPPRVKTD